MTVSRPLRPGRPNRNSRSLLQFAALIIGLGILVSPTIWLCWSTGRCFGTSPSNRNPQQQLERTPTLVGSASSVVPSSSQSPIPTSIHPTYQPPNQKKASFSVEGESPSPRSTVENDHTVEDKGDHLSGRIPAVTSKHSKFTTPGDDEDINCPCPLSLIKRIGEREASLASGISSSEELAEAQRDVVKPAAQVGTGRKKQAEKLLKLQEAFEEAKEAELQTCIEFLANYSNVEKTEAMLSSARFGRTVKMRLEYRIPEGSSCVRPIVGVAKLPQQLFPMEPYAEYLSYEIASEVLGMSYVPPTTWIFIPIADLEHAAHRNLNGLTEEDVDQLVKGKEGGDNNNEGAGEKKDDSAASWKLTNRYSYARWFAREALLYAMNHDLILPRPDDGRLSLGCSIQLWVQGARTAQGTGLFYKEEEMVKKLRLIHKYPHQPVKLSGVMPELVEDTPPKSPAQESDRKYLKKYTSDMYVLDALIANDDRGPIKNTNIFRMKEFNEDGELVVGKKKDRNQGRGKMPYQFLLVDQGKSLYLADLPKGSPLAPPSDTSDSNKKRIGGVDAQGHELHEGVDQDGHHVGVLHVLEDRNRFCQFTSKTFYGVLKFRALTPQEQRVQAARERQLHDRHMGPGAAGAGGKSTIEDMAAANPGGILAYLREVIPLPILKHIGPKRLGNFADRWNKVAGLMSDCVVQFGEDEVTKL